MKIHIKHGHLIDPKNNIDAKQDIFIAAGKVLAIGQSPADFTPNQVIDATGLMICPGLVDLSARLREPGSGYKATIKSELQAAVAGGVTSLACSPDTQPVLDEPGLVEMLKHRAKQLNLTHVYPLGALTRKLEGKQLSEMCKLTDAGCIGFSQADTPITDNQVLLRAMQYAATFGYTLHLRAEDFYLAQDGVAHDGEVANRLGLKGIPSAAEVLALATMLRLAQETNTKLHLCRLSTAEGVAMVRDAKKCGVTVTCDVSINHLHLTEMDIGFFNTDCHVKPPLRTQRDKQALSQGLLDGTIDAICSDHAPVNEDAKLMPFAETEAGATGLELLLPLALKWAQHYKVSMPQMIALISSTPAKILGVHAGGLTMGDVADMCIFNADQYRTVLADRLVSQGKNTPFKGLELTGVVRWTIMHGQVVFQDT